MYPVHDESIVPACDCGRTCCDLCNPPLEDPRILAYVRTPSRNFSEPDVCSCGSALFDGETRCLECSSSVCRAMAELDNQRSRALRAVELPEDC